MLGPASRVEPCPLTERAAALAVLYRRVPGALRDRLVAEALGEAARGEVDLSGLFVARRRGQVVGAMLTQTLAGGAAAVWAPEVDLSWGRSTAAAALVRAVLDDLKARGIRLAQALLDASAPPESAADLARGGMPRVTELVAMARATADPLPLPEGLPAIGWAAYGPETEDAFRAVVRQTYLESLDMPELEGVRSLDDVLAGQRAAGRFHPDRWQLGRLVGATDDAGVVLLTPCLDRDAWEVAYLGLSPAARGRGLGRAFLARALELARPHVPRLELSVDVRNTPAVNLYRHAGFTPYDRRSVHLARLA